MCTCFLACARASTIAACKPSCKVRQAGDRERLPNSRLAVCMMYMNMHMYMYVYMHMYMHMYVHHFRVEHQPSPTLSPTDPVGQSWPRGTGSVGDSVGEGTMLAAGGWQGRWPRQRCWYIEGTIGGADGMRDMSRLAHRHPEDSSRLPVLPRQPQVLDHAPYLLLHTLLPALLQLLDPAHQLL